MAEGQNEESKDFAFEIKTAKTLKLEEKFLTTGCSKIDEVLKGGISRKGITEIYGAAGTGKTQFSLQLCLTVQMPLEAGGCGAGAAYICTEAVFPTRRLQELLHKSDVGERCGATGDSIFVEHVSTVEELEVCVTQRIPCLIAAKKIGLLVIDSIAAPYRVEFSNKELKIRAKSLRAIGSRLHRIANSHNVHVVCINQVSANVAEKNLGSIHNKEQPVLGLTWANMITNSLYLFRRGPCRYGCIMKSPYLPRDSVRYEITDRGVVSAE